jgi:hypothetical protein
MLFVIIDLVIFAGLVLSWALLPSSPQTEA